MKDDAHHMKQIARFLAGEMMPKERESFKDWLGEDPLNQKLFEESQQIWTLTQTPPEEDLPLDLDQSWQRIETNLPEKEAESIQQISVKSPWNIRRLSQIAAVFLIGIAALLWWQQPLVIEETLSIHTQAGEKKEWQLPDGSKVWLNENTRIEYAASFQPRTLKLEGEAFFEVVRKETLDFVIESGNTQTSVLGTSFNLRAYPEEERVELLVNSGKVAFGNIEKTGEALVLEKGSVGVFDRPSQTLQRLATKDANAMAWKTEILEFENTPLTTVVPILERYFGTEIQASNPNIMNCHLTGKYTQPNMEQMLMVLSFNLNLEVETQDKGYVLKGAGCESD
ncbi:MAG: FecR domain-containing protein [Bacteroidota bacterium]